MFRVYLKRSRKFAKLKLYTQITPWFIVTRVGLPRFPRGGKIVKKGESGGIGGDFYPRDNSQ
jgi:hypothetical protein